MHASHGMDCSHARTQHANDAEATIRNSWGRAGTER